MKLWSPHPQLFPLCRLVEVGLCRLDASDLPPDWGFAPGSLPPLGASPDALIRHCGLLLRRRRSGGSINGNGSGAGSGMEEAGLAQQLGRVALGAGPGNSSANVSSAAMALQEQQQWVEEVVEVKNSCPFGLEARPHGGQRYQVRCLDRPSGAPPAQLLYHLSIHPVLLPLPFLPGA